MGYVQNANGDRVEQVRATVGLAATFFGIVTVNTTGAQILAANLSRQQGVWLHSNTGTNVGLFGDTIDTAVVPLSPGAGTNYCQPIYIPGTGALYVKAVVGPVQVVGYWV